MVTPFPFKLMLCRCQSKRNDVHGIQRAMPGEQLAVATVHLPSTELGAWNSKIALPYLLAQKDAAISTC